MILLTLEITSSPIEVINIYVDVIAINDVTQRTGGQVWVKRSAGIDWDSCPVHPFLIAKNKLLLH